MSIQTIPIVWMLPIEVALIRSPVMPCTVIGWGDVVTSTSELGFDIK